MISFVRQSYHRRLLEEKIRREASKISGNILDIGSGSRRYDALFNGQIVAVDVVPSVEKDIQFADLEETLSFPSNYFDSLLCLEVLNYIDNYKQALLEVQRVLKPGGVALISTAYMYHEYGDKVRFSMPYLRELLTPLFSEVQAETVGNASIVIWDILRKKIIFSHTPLIWRAGLLTLALPYLVFLLIIGAEQWKDKYYSGLFFRVTK